MLRFPCLVANASDWRNIHPHQPLPRDPSCRFILARLKAPLDLLVAPPLVFP